VKASGTTAATAGTIYLHSASGQLLGEYSAATGAPLREYLWLGTMPVAVLADDHPGIGGAPPIFIVHTDHLDTPRVLLDRSGAQRWSWVAEPFGNSTPNESPIGLPALTLNLRMPGQYFDAETGLAQNWHREYDASVARYTQSDPIGLQGGINTYSYAESRPTSLVDPQGLAACPGGTWDQEFGDLGFQGQFGAYGSVSNVNVRCRAKPSLKCKAKLACVGGGLGAGGGVGVSTGGVVFGAADSSNLGGWGGWQVNVGAGPFSLQGGGGRSGRHRRESRLARWIRVHTLLYLPAQVRRLRIQLEQRASEQWPRAAALDAGGLPLWAQPAIQAWDSVGSAT
jgi:RHS repeat-associated protein